MKAFLLWLALAAAALADMQVSVHVIEMPQEQAVALADQDASGEVLFRKARELVRRGHAKLFDTAVLRVIPGTRATAESIHEHISPTEPEPPEGAGHGGMPQGPPPKFIPRLRLPQVPPALLTRNVGSSLAADSEGLAWSFTLLRGETVSEDWTDELGNRHQIRRPAYVSFNGGMNYKLLLGRWILASVQSSSGEDGKIDPSRKLVAFLRADNLAPEAAK